MMVHQNKVKLQPWWRRLNYGASEGKNVCVNSFKMSLNKRGTRSNDLQKEWQMAAGAGRAVLNRPPEASIPPKCFPKWRQSRRRLVSITRVCHLHHKFSFRKKKIWSTYQIHELLSFTNNLLYFSGKYGCYFSCRNLWFYVYNWHFLHLFYKLCKDSSCNNKKCVYGFILALI